MSDVFYIKQGSTSPAISTTLLDPDGQPVDLTGATALTFRMSGPDDVTGTAQVIAPATDGRLEYEWQAGDLDTWGGYAVEWVVVDSGNTDIYPGPGYDWVEVIPNLTTVVGGVCTLADVRRELGRAMTDPEYARATNLILQLTAILERHLNRKFATVTITDEEHRIDTRGRLQLFHGPVLAVSAITVDDVAWTGDLTAWDQIRWAAGTLLKVTYTAGSEADAGVAGIIAQAVARTITAPAAVATGALSGYSVEGTSITYGDVSGSGADGGVSRLTVGDIQGMRRLKRPVLWT